MSEENLLHLWMIYGVPTNVDIPAIWTAVANTKSRQEGYSRLVTHLMSSILDYRRDFHGHTNLLHCSVPLYNFVVGNRFINPGGNPCLSRRGCQCGHPSKKCKGMSDCRWHPQMKNWLCSTIRTE